MTRRARAGSAHAAGSARSAGSVRAAGTRCLALVLVAALALVAEGAAAAPRDTFREGTDALALGKFDDAIALLEAYADREPAHPDASFNRALAYLTRVRAGAERAGDLGRAAAALEETLILRRADADAAHALELVRNEVARRRAGSQKNLVVATPSLDRLVVGLASPRTWGLFAIAASWLFALGILMRRKVAGSVRLAGTLLTPLALVALVAFLPLALGSARLATRSRPGVLVVREAFLTDEAGQALGGDPVVEAARLELGVERGALVHARYGTREGWLPSETVCALGVQ